MLTDSQNDKALADYRSFLAGRRTVVIATRDENRDPFLSIAPFVVHDGALYVYVSEVADHYRYLRAAQSVRILVHGDESASPNVFGVERAAFVCTAEQQSDEGRDAVFEKFAEHTNAKLVETLRGLDFHLFRLTPQDGRYVVGFGKAFEVSFDGGRFDHVVVDKKPGDKKPADQTA
ncbi:pyridoxamine 5'-phosphate oxidase family protein [Speluncibacter jeojiensis]|uniref:Pyridoxamine 5'-phosphate oxidase family protein n=1 Tax=Speluncibacter jeojiensis TaxID=2710754 RepID=A0A9X4LWU8_9ACTN|nr:pyridoxamine 5'-phosphate oxidase family protein [Corynebacteriales bacterium D3-21]